MDRGTSELNKKVCDLHQQLLTIPIRGWPLVTGRRAGAMVGMPCLVFRRNLYL